MYVAALCAVYKLSIVVFSAMIWAKITRRTWRSEEKKIWNKCAHTQPTIYGLRVHLYAYVLIYFNFDLNSMYFLKQVSYFSRVFKIHTNDYNIFFAALKNIFQITQQTKQYGYVSVTCTVVPDVFYPIGALYIKYTYT